MTEMPFELACSPAEDHRVRCRGGAYGAGLSGAIFDRSQRHFCPTGTCSMDDRRQISLRNLSCNWLQCMDNSLDPLHFEHLHGVYGNYLMKRLGRPPMLTVARHLKIAFDVFEYGIYKRRLVEGQMEDSCPRDWTKGSPNPLSQYACSGWARADERADRVRGRLHAARLHRWDQATRGQTPTPGRARRARGHRI